MDIDATVDPRELLYTIYTIPDVYPDGGFDDTIYWILLDVYVYVCVCIYIYVIYIN